MATEPLVPIDLRSLQTRIAAQRHDNTVFTFEEGQVVARSHAQVHADVAAACARLTEWGLKPGMRVGIRSPNCYEWVIYDLALLELRAVIVGFTDDFAGMKAADLCEKYALSLILLAKTEREAEKGSVAPIAYLDADNANVKVVQRAVDTDPEYDKIGFIFSSGSSGGLKGLTLNRRGIEASVDAFTQAVVPRRDDCLLLFLPISNFQQRLMYYAAFWYGFNIIITDPNRLFRALKELHPTILIAPPVLYEAFETRFYNLPPFKRWMAQILADIALIIPIRALREKIGRSLFSSAHEALGGRMRFMVTGMAPIKLSTLRLCRRMQLPLFQTYGLIESGSVSLNLPSGNRLGSVGRLLPGIEVKFAPDGEIIVRRKHSLCLGYFECAPGESERTFIGDGLVATGDVGRMDSDGYLYLVGRKKEIIITAGGEKVHPESLEAEIDACPEVARSVVLFHSDSPALAAVIVPKNPQAEGVRERIQRFIDGVNERQRLVSVGTVLFSDEPFTRENGFLRPNLKLDRNRIAQHFLVEAKTGSGPAQARKRSA